MPSPRVRVPKLLELLSEFLAVKRAAATFCEQARERTGNAAHRRALARICAESHRHADLLETAIRDLDGNPALPSAGAYLQGQRADSLLAFRSIPEFQELSDLETLFLVESRAQLDSEVLAELAPGIEDPHAKDLTARLARTLDGESARHAAWAKEALAELMVRNLTRPAARGKAA